MKTQVRTGGSFRICGRERMCQVKPAQPAPEGAALEYARRDAGSRKGAEEKDRNHERERIKEQLMSFVKEAVKKQLREEREFYRSRPSLAAKQYERLFGAGLGNSLVPAVSRRVFEQVEEHMRWERIRKGR